MLVGDMRFASGQAEVQICAYIRDMRLKASVYDSKTV